jgi:hypothetical protein
MERGRRMGSPCWLLLSFYLTHFLSLLLLKTLATAATASSPISSRSS